MLDGSEAVPEMSELLRMVGLKEDAGEASSEGNVSSSFRGCQESAAGDSLT